MKSKLWNILNRLKSPSGFDRKEIGRFDIHQQAHHWYLLPLHICLGLRPKIRRFHHQSYTENQKTNEIKTIESNTPTISNSPTWAFNSDVENQYKMSKVTLTECIPFKLIQITTKTNNLCIPIILREYEFVLKVWALLNELIGRSEMLRLYTCIDAGIFCLSSSCILIFIPWAVNCHQMIIISVTNFIQLKIVTVKLVKTVEIRRDNSLRMSLRLQLMVMIVISKYKPANDCFFCSRKSKINYSSSSCDSCSFSRKKCVYECGSITTCKSTNKSYSFELLVCSFYGA